MPIRPFLAGQAFNPETIKTMSDVLERICAEIGVTLGGTGKNPAAEIVAAKGQEGRFTEGFLLRRSHLARSFVKGKPDLYLAWA